MKFPSVAKTIAGLSAIFTASACVSNDFPFPRPGYYFPPPPPPVVYRNWGIVTPPNNIPSQSITVYPDPGLPPPERHADGETPPEPKPPAPIYNKPEPGTGQPVPLLRRTPG